MHAKHRLTKHYCDNSGMYTNNCFCLRKTVNYHNQHSIIQTDAWKNMVNAQFFTNYDKFTENYMTAQQVISIITDKDLP